MCQLACECWHPARILLDYWYKASGNEQRETEMTYTAKVWTESGSTRSEFTKTGLTAEQVEALRLETREQATTGGSYGVEATEES